MKKFFIASTSACLERMLDCKKFNDYLIASGWQKASEPKQAQLMIITTCSFGKDEDESSIDFIKYYRKRISRSCRIVIAGCLPKINPLELSKLGVFDVITPTNIEAIERICEGLPITLNQIKEPNYILNSEISYRPILKKILRARFSANSLFYDAFNLMFNSFTYLEFMKATINPFLVSKREKFFYIRISRGCLGSCSYCAKRFATGRLCSKPLADIILEFRKGLSEGMREFYLVSEDAGCYGIDKGISIIELLREIRATGKGYRYKLVISNVNAQWFIQYYEELEKELLLNCDNILFIQVPIQSGSDKVLKLMNRPYRIGEVSQRLKQLKEKIPSLRITTDLIVGFPQETEEDFSLTSAFLEHGYVDYADIFKYEDRPNTFASGMNNKIDNKIINKRMQVILMMQSRNIKSNVVIKKALELSSDFI